MDEKLLTEAIRGNFLDNEIMLIQPKSTKFERSDMSGWVAVTFVQSVRALVGIIRRLTGVAGVFLGAHKNFNFMCPLHASRCC
jgi:hypothetical protein